MPGGFHPFHAGHMALYNSARKAFPDADLYVAATNSQEERPFPFAVKEKLAKVAGVEPGHFVQVKSPFQAKEITQNYNPEEDVLIFVRSEKDKNESPKPGGIKKDGSPSYFQPWTGKDVQPFGKHAYFAYLPTVKFGPGITSATEIRKAWPTLNDKRKTAMVMSLYPAAQKNQKLAANIVAMLDQVMGGQVDEGKRRKKKKSSKSLRSYFFPGYAYYGGSESSEGGGDGGGGESAQQGMSEDQKIDPITAAVISFYKPVVNDIHKEKLPDYVDQARELLQKTNDPGIRSKLIDIFKKGKENPYIQGGIVTTVGAVLAGGILTTAQKMGLSPAQTNLALQAILNTVIPTVVSRINGKNWSDTIKYTLASAGIGTGIAGASLIENDPWGDQGNFAGDKPVNIGGDSVKRLDVGDMVSYLGRKAKIEAQSKDRIYSRITILSDFGGITKDVPTKDLKRVSQDMEETKGLPFPGTYEQENDMFKSHGPKRMTSLTSENMVIGCCPNEDINEDYLDEK